MKKYYLVRKTTRTSIYKVSIFWNQRLFETLWKSSKMLVEKKKKIVHEQTNLKAASKTVLLI